jgi:hypothetical protein
MRRLLSLLALLSLFCFATACTPVRGGSGDDDDDDTSDDDDTGDDDDATGDDDDATGDDDDSAGDDDDATGDDDDATLTEGNSTLGGIYTVSYWSDSDASVPVCQQAYMFDGVSETRVGVLGNSCPLCTGKIDITNIVDISSTGPGAGSPLEAFFDSVVTIPCVPATHFANGQADYGAILSSTAQSPGGDWLGTQGLIDAGTGIANNMGVASIGNMDTFASFRDTYSANGATFTNLGYVSEATGGQLTELGLDTVAVEAGAGTGYWPFWIYYTTSGATDGRFIGSYGVGSPWLLTQNGAGIDYETLTFGGTVVGQ